MTQTLAVQGMTCENCVRHVTGALLDLPGVRSADVDLARGLATIEADPEVPRATVAAALEEAGYALA